jgi:hypothetical protein
MSLINDALKRAENAKLDKLSETESTPRMASATYGHSSRGRLFAPITLVCLLVAGGGFVAYRYLGPGDGPGPRTATAGPKTPVPPAPHAAPWVNPAFKDITPREAIAIRAELAESAVNQFLSVGNAMGEYATSLRSIEPKIAKPSPGPPVKPSEKPKEKVKPPVVAIDFDPAKFEVGGIMYNGAKSRALINGTVYRIGQKISGAVVESITPTCVTLRAGDARFKLGI